MNQIHKKSKRRNPQSLSSFEKEIFLRKRANSKIKLTKHEIKLAEKLKSNFASALDTLLMLVSFLLPLVFANYMMIRFSIILGPLKLPILFVTSLIFCGLFYLINFKWLKFSLGEKFAGIEKVYLNQEINSD
jgi:hypothetical protein